MRNKVFLIIALIALHTSVFAQTTDSTRISILEQQNKALQEDFNWLRKETLELAIRIEGLNYEMLRLNNDVAESEKRNGENISENFSRVLQMESHADSIRTESHNLVNNRSLLGGGLLLSITFVLIVLFVWLKESIKEKGDDIELLRARADDLSRQIVERMDKELEELTKVVTQTASPTNSSNAEPDHTLVKALADRLSYMETTLYRMDKGIKGYKNLCASVRRMKDNLLANGYELVEMLGKDYVDGMKATPAFYDDDSIEQGKRIITSVMKPQINYKGKMIQAAEITVSQNI